MKAQIRKLVSPDLLDLEAESPSDPEDFCILIQMIAGPSDGPGEESFDFLVCTPSWIASVVDRERFLFGRNYLIVQYYDYRLISEQLNRLCQRISGKDWTEIAHKLNRFGHWEFEDYKP